MSGDKQQANGAGPDKDEVNGTDDIEMTEDGSKSKKTATVGKGKDGEDEMTVVVPPSRGSKTPTGGKDADMDDATDGTAKNENQSAEPPVDPKEKAINGIHVLA